MSYTNAKAQLKLALASVTWSIPTTAALITTPALRSNFGRVDTQQFAGEDAAIDASQFPYVRIWIPDLDEKRKSSGGDTGSYKYQTFPAHLFIYQAGMASDWPGLGDYFDAVIDATLAYFRNHSAPQGAGGVTLPANDQIRAWGLHQRSRVEIPEQFGETLQFRATVAVDLTVVII